MFNKLHKNITVPDAEIPPLEYDLKAQHRGSLSVMEQEIWKNIDGYENKYQASSLGRIKSLDHYVNGRYIDFKRLIKGRILKQYLRKDGYLEVTLSDNCEQIGYLSHRLIAITFLLNPKKNQKLITSMGLKQITGLQILNGLLQRKI